MSLRLGTRDTPDEAKQFAQSDIERCVLASLEAYRSVLSERPDPTMPGAAHRAPAGHAPQPAPLRQRDRGRYADQGAGGDAAPRASEEHKRLDLLVHEIAAMIEGTSPEQAKALSDAFDALLAAEKRAELAEIAEAKAEQERLEHLREFPDDKEVGGVWIMPDGEQPVHAVTIPEFDPEVGLVEAEEAAMAPAEVDLVEAEAAAEEPTFEEDHPVEDDDDGQIEKEDSHSPDSAGG